MSTVRAKFRVHCVIPQGDGFRVDLSPVYDSNPESENGRFYKATPWGQITLGTVNPNVGETLKPGTEVYVDFTPVPAAG
jgi:hypothetical protein